MKTTVTVCSACLRASCWQGIFYCEDARGAGTREMRAEELRQLGREHEDYFTDGGAK